ncbi:alpha/beta hydrolase fold [Rubrivivax gelatinosus IL144]|uniref:Alpha/beta hydrolase fold n=2 Tax=Rubrivivax gelatinosus TaxID=28068 RepID=I0HQA4_RUBGI|nr:alpha/beta hydrolase fold [Rubrivivax gelatinosus IL144]
MQDRRAGGDTPSIRRMDNACYAPRRTPAAQTVALRGLRYHVRRWGDGAPAGTRPLVLLHGWMDCGASFQFLVDALAEAEGRERQVFAPDWRGFGLTEAPPTDAYWFPDYLADLDALLDALVPDGAVDLLGHSMGGNVAMSYAALRPQRVRRLVNLEGYGLPATAPDDAPARLVQWLDELKTAPVLRDYADSAEVAARLKKNNPLLAADKAAWLATQWSAPTPEGRRRLLADPAHKRVNPVLYRREEAVATWRRIAAPLLFVEGDLGEFEIWWGHRYPREDFESRLAVVPRLERERLAPCGHMVHHDQPEALARRLASFLE